MKIERQNGKDYVIHYEDLKSLLDDRATGARNAVTAERMSNLVEGSDWFGPGCRRSADFIKRAEEGWPELTALVTEYSERLKLSPDVLPLALTQATRRKRVRSDSGSDLDIHAVYQGQLDRAWSATRHEVHESRRKAAHLYIAIGGNYNESARDSLWRAAAAHRICDMFQRCGFSVEITVGSSADGVFTNGGRVRCHTSFTAKTSSMPIDLNRVALQSTLGWHRVYSFISRAKNGRGLTVDSTMGTSAHGVVTPYVLEREASGELLVYVPSSVNSEASAKRAIDEARRQLETYGKAAA